MKKTLVLVGLLMAVALVAVAAESGTMSLKVGDVVYVCNCGEGCACNSMAMKSSTCACGKEMAEGKVIEVKEAAAVIQIGSREQTFKTVGKYACACGPACDCGAISQQPAKCACGKEMAAVLTN